MDVDGRDGQAEEHIPAWAQSYINEQQDLMQQFLAQQQAAFNAETQRLRTELQSVTQQFSQGPTPASNTTNDPTRRPRPRLPDPEKFDGGDLSLYPQFESQLKAKLAIDEAAIGGPVEQIWYGFSRLGGKAASRIHPWIATYERTVEFTVANFFSQLQTAFKDAAQQEKALDKLNSLRQGNKPFDEFLSEFDRLLLEAGGHAWDNRVKKGYMKSALNHTIRDRMVAMEEKESYEEFTRQVKSIADRLAELKAGRSRTAAPGSSPTKPVNESDGAMDWEATVSAVQTRRAKWVSSSTIEQRKRDGKCFRCGAGNHRIRECPYLSARRPSRPTQEDARKAKVAHVDLDGAELEEGSPANERAEKE
jgi:hypothetical protein